MTSRETDRLSGSRSIPGELMGAPPKSGSLYTFVLHTDQFIGLLDHPNQRDTVKRARMASHRHLKHLSEAHRSVAIARFEGRYYKVDGHTRSYLWSNGKLEKPDTVLATVIDCSTLDQLVEFYDSFDSRSAAKSAVDNASGAVRFHDVEFQSNFMQSSRFTSALRIVFLFNNRTTTGFNVRDAVGVNAAEMEMLDTVNPDKSVFRSGVVAAALMLLRRHGEDIIPFLEDINQNRGQKDLDYCDPSFAASHFIAVQKARVGLGAGVDIASKVLAAGERYRRGQKVACSGRSLKLSGIDPYAYAEAIRREEKARPKGQ